MSNELGYVNIDEFIYNGNTNHKRQCFGEVKPYQICLEYESVRDDIVLYVRVARFEEEMYVFAEDRQWNEIDYVSHP